MSAPLLAPGNEPAFFACQKDELGTREVADAAVVPVFIEGVSIIQATL